MMLGRLPPKRSYKIPSLSKYTRAIALPQPPVVCTPPCVSFGMCLNDQIGDCTIAGVAHLIQLWNGNVLTDAQVLTAYEQIGGYDPAKPDSDQGCAETDVLTAWMTSGISNDTLAGYTSLNVTDLDEIRDAINWFGAVYIGLNLPQSAESNTTLWDVLPNDPIAGGHCVILVGYDDHFYAVSWGMLIPCTVAFLGAYMEEAYAPLNKDYVANNGKTPSGLDWSALETDMALLKGQAP